MGFLKLVEQLLNEMRTLTHLFMMLPDNFVSDFESNALEVSKARDKEVRTQMDIIEQKLNEVSIALTNDTRTEPLYQDGMNESMVEVMQEYIFICWKITLMSESKRSRDYTTGLNRIKTAKNNLAGAIDTYNEIAISKDWQMIQSLNESAAIAKRRNEFYSLELLKELGTQQ